MKNNNIVLAFSGGCFSGKTTTMKKIYEDFDNCILLDENVRKENIISIDDIRKNPVDYLMLQDRVTRKKIDQEIYAVNNNSNKIILIDRALTDSLFYLTFYLDKSNLNDYQYKIFIDLFNYIVYHINHSKYTNVFNFLPLNKNCDDKKYRPKNIDLLKFQEHTIISSFNNSFFSDRIIDFDMNNYNEFDKLYNFINKKIYNLKK